VRYTNEGKDVDNTGGTYGLEAPYTVVANSAYAYTDSIGHSAWTPKVGLEVRLPGDALVYVSATRGFKSGGFNISSTRPGRGYAPEFAWSYEGGWKGEVMGGRSRVDASAFVMNYTDLQVQTPIGIGVFDIRNAAAATIRGVEVETTSRIGRGFEGGGYVTWLDATYDRYIAVSNLGVVGDVSGNRLNNAPQWAGRAWVEWAGAIGRANRLSIAADSTAQSTVFYTPFNDPIQRQSPYGLLGARVEYGPNHRRWVVSAYVRNLTNVDYITATFGTPPTAYGGRPGPSRQLAIDFTVRR
jgi:iron complex outermembrane receptor protein